MSCEDILGVAVIGLGIGERHARTFSNIPGCRLTFLLDLDISRADVLARKFDGCSVAKSYQQILDSKEIDIIVIASHDDAHFGATVEALSAGKHVFVEKPMCRTLDELRTIKSTWLKAEKRLILRSNLILRTAPYYLWLKEQVQNGFLGRLYAIDGDYLYGRIHKIVDGWRAGISDYSVMNGGGLHLIDLAIWISDQRPNEVTAIGNKICTSGGNFRYLDYVAATLEFDSGLIGRITANFGCVHRHQHVLRMFGTNGTAIYDDVGIRIHNTNDPNVSPTIVHKSALPTDKGQLIPAFVDAIKSNDNDSCITQSYFDGLSISIAINNAVRSGRRERIEYV